MMMPWLRLAMSRNNTRFFCKSLPQEVKDARPELVAVSRIGQCLWNRDYAGVYTAAQGFEWGPDLADFMIAFLSIVLVFTVLDGVQFSYACCAM
jgi:hypothetical protein